MSGCSRNRVEIYSATSPRYLRKVLETVGFSRDGGSFLSDDNFYTWKESAPSGRYWKASANGDVSSGFSEDNRFQVNLLPAGRFVKNMGDAVSGRCEAYRSLMGKDPKSVLLCIYDSMHNFVFRDVNAKEYGDSTFGMNPMKELWLMMENPKIFINQLSNG